MQIIYLTGVNKINQPSKSSKDIFKKGSRTFFVSSLFFPEKIKKDVFDLYSFVRIADDYVDQIPQDRKNFNELKSLWQKLAKKDTFQNNGFQTTPKSFDSINMQVVKNMIRQQRKHKIDDAWVAAFLKSMESDLSPTDFKSIDDTLEYIYGSAEVIGLMMSRIMDLPPAAENAAALQGRAMQIINFIRDIEEDNQLGRQYFPKQELKQFGLEDLSQKSANNNLSGFTKFIHYQIDRYLDWQNQAAQGYKYIPYRLRVPVKTASDMYNWTAMEIRRNPLIVYESKVKPSKKRIVLQISKNTLLP